MTRDRRLRVLVVDDHPLFREGLAATLDELDDIEVVASAGTGEEAIKMVDGFEPDVVLMDLHMPGMGGIAATRELVAAHQDLAVLVLTMLEDDESLLAAASAGAKGYLLKEATADEILRAVVAVAEGQVIFGGRVGAKVLAALAEQPTSGHLLEGFTDREHEVLHLLAQGLTNAAIAGRLHVSDKTVRNYVSILFTKLDVSDRTAAAVRAREAGYGT